MTTIAERLKDIYKHISWVKDKYPDYDSDIIYLRNLVEAYRNVALKECFGDYHQVKHRNNLVDKDAESELLRITQENGEKSEEGGVMRLADLSPHWVQPAQWAEQSPPFYIGVSFLCPHCENTKCPTCGTQRGKRLAFNFWPPIDPDGWLARGIDFPHDKFHKRISGETFDTLTISPSIGLEPHWHGNITEGEILPPKED